MEMGEYSLKSLFLTLHQDWRKQENAHRKDQDRTHRTSLSSLRYARKVRSYWGRRRIGL